MMFDVDIRLYFILSLLVGTSVICGLILNSVLIFFCFFTISVHNLVSGNYHDRN